MYWLSSFDAGETETGSSTSSVGSLDHSDSVKFAVLRYTIQFIKLLQYLLISGLLFPHYERYVGTVKLLNI